MKPTFALSVRTPSRLVLETRATAVRAEDRSGWFGIAPGRTELVALLPVGLVLYTDADGEGFIAVGEGLLHMRRDVCRILVREALASRALATLTGELDAYEGARRTRRAREQVIFDALSREVLLRMAEEVRA